MDMSVSKKDKILLCVVGTLAVGVAYYSLVYTSMCDKVETKKNEKVQIEQQYNKAVDDIATLDTRKLDLKLLVGKATEKSSKFYPTISQDKLLDELNTLITAAAMKKTAITFTDKEVGPVEKFVLTNKNLQNSDLQTIVDKYKGNASSNATSNQTTTSTSTAKADGPKCEQIKATITVNSSEESIKKFLLSLEQYNKRINVTSIILSPKSESEVNGTISIEFYAVPKIDNSDDQYSNWPYNNVYGTPSLLGKEAASGAYNTTVEEATTEKQPDFVALLKAPNSTMLPLSLGKANDDTLSTYVYGRSSKVEEVEIDFTEENGKLYYNYKTESGKYPSDGSKGKEFTPNGAAIEILITSDARTGTDDTSGIKLKVSNKTSKKVNVTVKGDDTKNPRVQTPTTDGDVSVNQK